LSDFKGNCLYTCSVIVIKDLLSQKISVLLTYTCKHALELLMNFQLSYYWNFDKQILDQIRLNIKTVLTRYQNVNCKLSHMNVVNGFGYIRIHILINDSW